MLKTKYMKKALFLFLMISLSGKIKAQTTAAPAKDIDKIVTITNTDYDMGKIPSGKPLEYKLVIKNISKENVMIEDVKVGCGCTTPKFKTGENLLPGKSTFISLGFNGGATGEFTKTADILFKGGLSKQVKFHGIAVADSTTTKPQVPVQ